MKERYITDGGYGLKKEATEKGFCDETVKKDRDESWMEEYTEEMAYKNIGFGRDTGGAR